MPTNTHPYTQTRYTLNSKLSSKQGRINVSAAGEEEEEEEEEEEGSVIMVV